MDNKLILMKLNELLTANGFGYTKPTKENKFGPKYYGTFERSSRKNNVCITVYENQVTYNLRLFPASEGWEEYKYPVDDDLVKKISKLISVSY